MKPTKETPMPTKRPLFHIRGGGFDVSRMIEQLIPAVVIGAIVIFANAKVTEYQVSEMRKEIDRTAATTFTQQQQLGMQSEKLATIAAQMTAFLGQQIAVNTAMDARLTFIERQSYMGMGHK